MRALLTLGLLASAAVPLAPNAAEDWQDFAMVSTTMGTQMNRLCAGADDSDLGCPSYAPSLTTAGHVSVTGNLSAVKFIGDGSALTGLTTSGDRIVSGTSSIIVSESGHISFTTAGTERMVINASGNVGIGTSAPKAMVEIVSATDGAALLKLSSERAWCFRQNGTGATAALELRSLGNSQTHDCSAAVSNKNLVFNTTGNVGIGTTSPGKVLDVSGTAQITSRTLVGGTGTPSGTMHVSGTLFLAGDGGQGCDDSTAGIIRRNPTTGRLQVCK